MANINQSSASNRSYRWQIAARVTLAILGGYTLATIAGIFLSYLLPMTKSDAVMTGILVSFALYTGCVMWVFAVKTLRKAWLGLFLPVVILGTASLLLKITGIAP